MTSHRKRIFWIAFTALWLPGVVRPAFTQAVEVSPSQSSVGVAGTLSDLVLPGPTLKAYASTDSKQSIVLRVVEVRPHGTAHRYTIEFVGLEAGEYDLRDYLRLEDGSINEELPSIPVTIESLLPADQIEPNTLARQRTSWLRGYRLLIIGIAVAWFLGLVLLLRNREVREDEADPVSAVPLIARISPLIAEARQGTLTESQRAELERLVLAWCRERLDLDDMEAAESISQLRADARTAPIIQHLESWLHEPSAASSVFSHNGNTAPTPFESLEQLLCACESKSAEVGDTNNT